MQSSLLEPCPLCGNADVDNDEGCFHFPARGHVVEHWAIQCGKPGCVGIEAPTRDDCIRMWNTRAEFDAKQFRPAQGGVTDAIPWVSVFDRLPVDPKRYLCVVMDGTDVHGVEIRTWNGSEWFGRGGGMSTPREPIVFWCDLPQTWMLIFGQPDENKVDFWNRAHAQLWPSQRVFTHEPAINCKAAALAVASHAPTAVLRDHGRAAGMSTHVGNASNPRCKPHLYCGKPFKGRRAWLCVSHISDQRIGVSTDYGSRRTIAVLMAAFVEMLRHNRPRMKQVERS